MTKKIVFYAETDEYWAVYYTERTTIYGVIICKREAKTLNDFKMIVKRCEDVVIEPQDLIGARIVEIQEVE
jgi:hypothetical protein